MTIEDINCPPNEPSMRIFRPKRSMINTVNPQTIVVTHAISTVPNIGFFISACSKIVVE